MEFKHCVAPVFISGYRVDAFVDPGNKISFSDQWLSLPADQLFRLWIPKGHVTGCAVAGFPDPGLCRRPVFPDLLCMLILCYVGGQPGKILIIQRIV